MTCFEDLIWLFTSDKKSRGVVRFNIAEGALLYKYSKIKCNGVLLEIGRKFGGSTSLIAASLENGKLYSIDICYRPEVEENIKPWKDKITLINKDSQKVKWKKALDLLFIDGDHTLIGIKKDIKRYIPFVRRGGYVIFHDVGRLGIHKSIKDLLKNGWDKVSQVDSMAVLERL